MALALGTPAIVSQVAEEVAVVVAFMRFMLPSQPIAELQPQAAEPLPLLLEGPVVEAVLRPSILAELSPVAMVVPEQMVFPLLFR